MTDRDFDEIIRELFKAQIRLEHDKWETKELIRGVFMVWANKNLNDHNQMDYFLTRDKAGQSAVPCFESPLYINGDTNPPPYTQLFIVVNEHLRGRWVYELLAPAIEVLMQELAIEETQDDKATTID